MRQKHLSNRRAKLSPTKQALLDRRMQAKTAIGSERAPVSTIEPISRDGELPLSFAQESRLIYEQWARLNLKENVSLHLSKCFRLRGTLNLAALEQSLHEVARRHEVLRATFPFKQGRPAQVIAASTALPLIVIEAHARPDDASEAMAMKIISEQAHRPFDFANEVLWRVVVLRLGSDESILLLTTHHVISDAWSLEVLTKELAVLYHAFSSGASSPFSDLTVQYADFAHWQRQEMQGERLDQLLSYWKRQLKETGPFPTLNLPRASPRRDELTGSVASQSLKLSSDLTHSLRLLSRRENVTLYMLALAGLKLLLHRYTGQDNIGVRSPVAYRQHPETVEMVGWLANLLVFRTDLSGASNFLEVLGQVRRVVLEAYEHQDLPYPKLTEAFGKVAQPEQGTPVIFNMIQKTNGSQKRPELFGLKTSDVQVPPPNALLEPGLTVYLIEGEKELHLSINYHPQKFAADMIAGMLENFRALLEESLAHPTQPLSDIRLPVKP